MKKKQSLSLAIFLKSSYRSQIGSELLTIEVEKQTE